MAYRYFATPNRKFIIADTPGHEQYTRNMVTGASTADLAIVLIDARNGVLTQSKRHSFLASLLGIPHMLVAVNKMNLVNWSEDRYLQIVAEYTAFCEKINVHDIKFIPVSALLEIILLTTGPRCPGMTALRCCGIWRTLPSPLTEISLISVFPCSMLFAPTRISSGMIAVGERPDVM